MIRNHKIYLAICALALVTLIVWLVAHSSSDAGGSEGDPASAGPTDVHAGKQESRTSSKGSTNGSAKFARRNERELESIRPTNIPGAHCLERIRLARRSGVAPRYELFDSEGYVNSQVIEAFGLDAVESTLLQELTEDFLVKTSEKIKKGISPDPIRSVPEEHIRAFKITDIDLGHEFSEYSSRLADSFGEQIAGEMLISLPVEKYYSEFGKHDVFGRVFENDRIDPDFGYKTVMLFKDPETGELQLKTTSYSAKSNRLFPGVFDFDMSVNNTKFHPGDGR